jgi:hypothetical protein
MRTSQGVAPSPRPLPRRDPSEPIFDLVHRSRSAPAPVAPPAVRTDSPTPRAPVVPPSELIPELDEAEYVEDPSEADLGLPRLDPDADLELEAGETFLFERDPLLDPRRVRRRRVVRVLGGLAVLASMGGTFALFSSSPSARGLAVSWLTFGHRIDAERAVHSVEHTIRKFRQ